MVYNTESHEVKKGKHERKRKKKINKEHRIKPISI